MPSRLKFYKAYNKAGIDKADRDADFGVVNGLKGVSRSEKMMILDNMLKNRRSQASAPVTTASVTGAQAPEPLVGYNDTARPVQTYKDPVITTEGVKERSEVAAPTPAPTPVVETPAPAPTPKYVFGNYTQDDIDAMSMAQANAAARAAGLNSFSWRVGQNAKNKSGLYATWGNTPATSKTTTGTQATKPAKGAPVNTTPDGLVEIDGERYDPSQYVNSSGQTLGDVLKNEASVSTPKPQVTVSDVTGAKAPAASKTAFVFGRNGIIDSNVVSVDPDRKEKINAIKEDITSTRTITPNDMRTKIQEYWNTQSTPGYLQSRGDLNKYTDDAVIKMYNRIYGADARNAMQKAIEDRIKARAASGQIPGYIQPNTDLSNYSDKAILNTYLGYYK